MKRAIVLAAFLTGIASLEAELPPWVYSEQQDKAPEALVIKVQSVTQRETTEEKWKRVDFVIEAEVQKVERSASKLAPGATITIQYSRREYFEPIAGPREVPRLKQGQVYPAYLVRDGNMYSPAAGGYSFQAIR